ncbi:MAG TPA: hypothetical protein VGD63_10280 [Steroidobacteraceae bacterium]
MSASSARLERLALLSATHGGLPLPVATVLRRAIETIERGGFDGYLEGSYPTYFSADHARDPVLKRCFLEMARTVGKDAGLWQMRALLAIDGPFTGLGQIHCPIILLVGRKDRRTTPAAHELLAQESPGSELTALALRRISRHWSSQIL